MKSNCQQFRPQLSALADQNLEPEQRTEVEEHLDSCSDCSKFLQQELELVQLLGSERFQLEPPPIIWNRIQEQLQSSELPRWRWVFGQIQDAFQVSELRYAFASLVLLLMLSAVFVDSGSKLGPDPQILAHLDSYTVEVKGNPFWAGIEDARELRDNPFRRSRSHK
jgi:predicted anti-sigma-YlaC factor YlaD